MASSNKVLELRRVTRERLEKLIAEGPGKGYELRPISEGLTGSILAKTVTIAYEYGPETQRLTLTGVSKPFVFSWTKLMHQVLTHAIALGMEMA